MRRGEVHVVRLGGDSPILHNGTQNTKFEFSFVEKQATYDTQRASEQLLLEFHGTYSSSVHPMYWVCLGALRSEKSDNQHMVT